VINSFSTTPRNEVTLKIWHGWWTSGSFINTLYGWKA
jgi:hypothetical protein